jgi:hypothetical protein
MCSLQNINFRIRLIHFAAITTTKNPAFHFGSRVAKEYKRDSYLLPGPPLSSTAKWAKEATDQIRPLPRVEDMIVPAVGLLRCGLRFFMSVFKTCSGSTAIRQYFSRAPAHPVSSPIKDSDQI